MNRLLLQNELERDEGIRLKPYQDTVGKWTIGIGRNLSDVGISTEEAHHLLANDIDHVCNDLDKRFPWWRDLSETRQRVLANMCFNMGIFSLAEFRHTLTAIQTGDFKAAAAGMLASRWAIQVGPRANRLAQMMEEG